jgi:hypothetical protein
MFELINLRETVYRKHNTEHLWRLDALLSGILSLLPEQTPADACIQPSGRRPSLSGEMKGARQSPTRFMCSSGYRAPWIGILASSVSARSSAADARR